MIAAEGPYCPYIHGCGDSPRQHPWRIAQRRLAHYLLVASLDGSEQLVVDGRPYVIPTGGVYLIQPGQLADIGSAMGNRPAWVHFDVRFDRHRTSHPYAGPYQATLGPRAAFLQPDARAVWGIDLPVLVPTAIAAGVARHLLQLIADWTRGDPMSVLEATHHLGGLLLRLAAHAWSVADAFPPTEPGARIDRAEAVARRSLDTAFDVDAFARAAGYSRSRFVAVFTARRGMSPGRWLREERLRAASDLLTRADLPVAEIGAAVGYPDPTVFGRTFRAWAGMSPTRWRDRRRR